MRYDQSEWHFYKNPWWREVTLIDGTKKRGEELMRRIINGGAQYRLRSASEETEYDYLMAW
jgi:hypothetical protein